MRNSHVHMLALCLFFEVLTFSYFMFQLWVFGVLKVESILGSLTYNYINLYFKMICQIVHTEKQPLNTYRYMYDTCKHCHLSKVWKAIEDCRSNAHRPNILQKIL